MKTKNKSFLAILLFLGIFFCSSISPVSGQSENIPLWAEENNYAKYNANYDFLVENTVSEENVKYTGSGTKTWTVKKVTNNYATVKISKDITWGENGPPPLFPSGEREENWYYFVSMTHFTLAEHYLDQLENGNIPDGLGDSFKGSEEIETPYDDFETFHLLSEENTSLMKKVRNSYYDKDSGVLVKYHLLGESEGKTTRTYGDSSLVLKDAKISKETRTKEAEDEPEDTPTSILKSPFLWIASLIIVIVIIIGLAISKRNQESTDS